MTAATSRDWRFFRAGGSDQVALERGTDRLNLQHLDPRLCQALVCPVDGLEIDSATLRLRDADSDGRLGVPPLLAPAKWATGLLRGPETLMKGGDLSLAMISAAAAETAASSEREAAETKTIDVGTVAALGVAFGAIGSLLVMLVGGLLRVLPLPFWKVVLALAVISQLILTPPMMNAPFGGALTKVAPLPANAGSSLQVKYPEPPIAQGTWCSRSW
ncbi:MAG: hypothetical protein ACKVS7_16430 [Gemmatimonadaceae bacterium]